MAEFQVQHVVELLLYSVSVFFVDVSGHDGRHLERDQQTTVRTYAVTVQPVSHLLVEYVRQAIVALVASTRQGIEARAFEELTLIRRLKALRRGRGRLRCRRLPHLRVEYLEASFHLLCCQP